MQNEGDLARGRKRADSKHYVSPSNVASEAEAPLSNYRRVNSFSAHLVAAVTSMVRVNEAGTDCQTGVTTEILLVDGKVKKIVARLESTARSSSGESNGGEQRVKCDNADSEWKTVPNDTVVHDFQMAGISEAIVSIADTLVSPVERSAPGPAAASLRTYTEGKRDNLSGSQLPKDSRAPLPEGRFAGSQNVLLNRPSDPAASIRSAFPRPKALRKAKTTDNLHSRSLADAQLAEDDPFTLGAGRSKETTPRLKLKCKAPNLKTAQRALERELKKKSSPNSPASPDKYERFHTIKGKRGETDMYEHIPSTTASNLGERQSPDRDTATSPRRNVFFRLSTSHNRTTSETGRPRSSHSSSTETTYLTAKETPSRHSGTGSTNSFATASEHSDHGKVHAGAISDDACNKNLSRSRSRPNLSIRIPAFGAAIGSEKPPSAFSYESGSNASSPLSSSRIPRLVPRTRRGGDPFVEQEPADASFNSFKFPSRSDTDSTADLVETPITSWKFSDSTSPILFKGPGFPVSESIHESVLVEDASSAQTMDTNGAARRVTAAASKAMSSDEDLGDGGADNGTAAFQLISDELAAEDQAMKNSLDNLMLRIAALREDMLSAAESRSNSAPPDPHVQVQADFSEETIMDRVEEPLAWRQQRSKTEVTDVYQAQGGSAGSEHSASETLIPDLSVLERASTNTTGTPMQSAMRQTSQRLTPPEEPVEDSADEDMLSKPTVVDTTLAAVWDKSIVPTLSPQKDMDTSDKVEVADDEPWIPLPSIQSAFSRVLSFNPESWPKMESRTTEIPDHDEKENIGDGNETQAKDDKEKRKRDEIGEVGVVDHAAVAEHDVPTAAEAPKTAKEKKAMLADPAIILVGPKPQGRTRTASFSSFRSSTTCVEEDPAIISCGPRYDTVSTTAESVKEARPEPAQRQTLSPHARKTLFPTRTPYILRATAPSFVPAESSSIRSPMPPEWSLSVYPAMEDHFPISAPALPLPSYEPTSTWSSRTCRSQRRRIKKQKYIARSGQSQSMSPTSTHPAQDTPLEQKQSHRQTRRAKVYEPDAYVRPFDNIESLGPQACHDPLLINFNVSENLPKPAGPFGEVQVHPGNINNLNFSADARTTPQYNARPNPNLETIYPLHTEHTLRYGYGYGYPYDSAYWSSGRKPFSEGRTTSRSNTISVRSPPTRGYFAGHGGFATCGAAANSSCLNFATMGFAGKSQPESSQAQYFEDNRPVRPSGDAPKEYLGYAIDIKQIKPTDPAGPSDLQPCGLYEIEQASEYIGGSCHKCVPGQ